MASVVQAESVPVSRTETITLRILVVLVAIGCLVEFWFANSQTETIRLHSPLFSPRLWNLYLTFKLAAVVALIAIWNWRMWGLQLLTAMGIAMLFTEFYVAESYSVRFWLGALRVPLVLGAIWYFAQRLRPRFT